MLFIFPVKASALPEFRLKAAFIYNFVAYTEWPATVGTDIHLCIYGENTFGQEILALEGRSANERVIRVIENTTLETITTCQVVFISQLEIQNLSEILNIVGNKPILTIADTIGAANRGVALNMAIDNNKIVFEANIESARQAGITLSAKLLRLATKVYQNE